MPGCGPGSAPAGLEAVVISGETFYLEVAADADARARGLMGRTDIPEDGGMLFVFPDSQIQVQRFWMGHCLVDIDILFLDSQGRVTATHEMKAQEPQRSDETDAAYDQRMPRYSSRYPAQFAIELKAGSLKRLGVQIEEKVELDLPRLKAQVR